MIGILIKSTACLAIFLLFYKLFLEKENMHVFKRFYLLTSILISIIIPFITFTQFVDIPVKLNDLVINKTTNPITIQEESVNYLHLILWSIYVVGVLIFSLKFIFNLYNISKKIKRNPNLKTQKSIHVLLEELIVPHTFLSYIFLNKTHFETQQIPEEVLIHEEAHVIQKHSLDILFIELFQIVFWFNPLIYLHKKAIKLNHEFLADLEVIEKGVTLSKYQQILLAFSSNALEPQLATAMNYSSIKKRFTVMKTQTSKTGIWLRSIVLLPILAVLTYSFSTKKVIQKETEPYSEIVNETQQKASLEELAEYNKLAKYYNSQPENKRLVKFNDLERMEYIFKKMSEEQKANSEPFPKCPPPPPNAPELKMADLPPPPPIPTDATPEEKVKYQKTIDKYYEMRSNMVKKGEESNIPPPPPPPKSPLDFVIDMAKKEATFYFEGKQISSDQAINILKEDKSMNISAKNSSSKNPKVYLSKEPITID
ncbi:M56 family metallopeptidase [Xanthomarina sp. GH4-25]|uniref:M56 family metallopeptidase n=1 Tax=Xanthomarina sp. GH4-25 TaxID=3349335 RepID=UPI0038783BD7